MSKYWLITSFFHCHSPSSMFTLLYSACQIMASERVHTANGIEEDIYFHCTWTHLKAVKEYIEAQQAFNSDFQTSYSYADQFVKVAIEDNDCDPSDDPDRLKESVQRLLQLQYAMLN